MCLNTFRLKKVFSYQNSLGSARLLVFISKFNFNKFFQLRLHIFMKIWIIRSFGKKRVWCPVRAAPAQSGPKFKSTSCLKVTVPVPSVFFSVLGLSV